MSEKKGAALRCAAAGALAGIATGLFGGGGGMVLVPLLLGFCGLKEKAAFAASVAIILPMCVVSVALYAFGSALPLGESVPYLIGGAIGGTLGGLWFRKIPAKLLKKGLAILLIYGGARCLLS